MRSEKELRNLFGKLCDMYGLDPEDTKGAERVGRHIDVRQVFAIIAKDKKYKYQEIGDFLRLDHSTVQYYCKDRHIKPREKRIIDSMIDHDTMIKRVANALTEDPGNPLLQQQMLKLLLNYDTKHSETNNNSG